jgi:hypothetical protein
MLRFTIAVAALALIAAPSVAGPCKDAKGKFVKCPAPAAHNVVKGKDGKCRVASGANKGKFTKC